MASSFGFTRRRRSQSVPKPRSPSHSIPFPSDTPSSLSPNGSTTDVLHEEPQTQSTPDLDDTVRIEISPTSHSLISESSMITTSDKLSELPHPLFATPRSKYPIPNPSRAIRRSFEGTSRGSPSDSPKPSGSNPYRASVSEGSSIGKESPKQGRISFESERSAGTARGSVPQFTARAGGQSEKPSPSAAVNALPGSKPRRGSDSQSSRSHSRATSPLRLFHWPLSRTFSRDEPFVPIDPFKWHFRICKPPNADSTDDVKHVDLDQSSCLDGILPFPCCIPTSAKTGSSAPSEFLENLKAFFLDTMPRQLYLNMLLHLPALYFSRVARIFEDAEVSKGDMQKVIDSSYRKLDDSSGGRGKGGVTHTHRKEYNIALPTTDEWVPPTVSPALARFKRSWEDFMDSLMREWKTLNLVSGLLCSAILSMFQVPDMAGDPVTRTAALLSLICALMSLSYGCTFILRFGTMKSMYRASRWAEEAQKTGTSIFWNVWVLLATPAVWLAWSMIAFIVSILSYVWRTGDTNNPNGVWPRLTPEQSLGPRVVITSVVGLGLVYFTMIVVTFARYGSPAPEHIALMRRNRQYERGEGNSERGRALKRDIDRKNNKEMMNADVRPSGVGLGLRNFVSSTEVDLEKDAGVEPGARGRYKPKL